MRVLTIPLVELPVYVYVGPKEWKRWVADCMAEGMDAEDECPDGGGMTYGGRIWLADTTSDVLLYHEGSHAVDNAMDSIGTDDGELRAYITGWLMSKLSELL